MDHSKYKFLIIENAIGVCEGIIERMKTFTEWESCGYATSVSEACVKIDDCLPTLIYLDWGLNGGSGYEVLQHIQNIPKYNPFIIFNTGFQKDNPEIPQVVFNSYKIDKYIIKPIWENLRYNLPEYLEAAKEKQQMHIQKTCSIWVEDFYRNKIKIELEHLVCISQHESIKPLKSFHFKDSHDQTNIRFNWKDCYSLLNSFGIDYFITKHRSHIVVRKYISSFERPFVYFIGNTSIKIEVVRESISAFEKWLLQEQNSN